MKKRILISMLCIAMIAPDLTGGIPMVRAQEEVVSETEMTNGAEVAEVEAVGEVSEAEETDAVEVVLPESVPTEVEMTTDNEEAMVVEVPDASVEVPEENGEENLADTYTLTAPVVGKWTGRWVTNWNSNVDSTDNFFYQVQVFKDGAEYRSGNYLSTAFSVCVASYIEESGVYKFRVRKIDSSNNVLSDWSEFSNERTYVRPDKQIETVKPYWDSEKFGVVCYVNPAYYGSYRYVDIEYRKDETENFQSIVSYNTSFLHHENFEEPAGEVDRMNLADMLRSLGYGAGQYRVALRLFSQNIDECAQNPNFGEWSDPVTYTEEDFKIPEVVYTESAPTTGNWEDKWVATWDNSKDDTNIAYHIEIWKNGEKCNGTTSYSYRRPAGVSLAPYITENGAYKFRVRKIDRGSYQTISDWSEFSEEKTYTKPTTQMAKVTALWDDTKKFAAYFNAPSYFYGSYETELHYRADENDGFHSLTTYNIGFVDPPETPVAKGTKVDIKYFTDYILKNGPGQYRFRVKPISKDIDKCAQSDSYGSWSELLTVTAEDIKAYEDANKIPEADSLNWSDKWEACWNTDVSDESYYRYDIEIWKDGAFLYLESEYLRPNKDMKYPITERITESGKYKFRVKVYSFIDSQKESDWSEFSEEKTYVKPKKQVASVKPTWSTKQKYSISFIVPDFFNGRCMVKMQYRQNEKDTFKDIEYIGYRDLVVAKGKEATCNVLDYFVDRHGAGQYRVAVKLYSSDITKYTHGAYGDYSDPITITAKDLEPVAPKCTVKGVFGGRTVTFENIGFNSSLYYALKKSKVELTDQVTYSGQEILFKDFYGYVYYAANRNGQWSETKSILLKIPTIQKPTITQSGNKVTIKTATPNCHIWYTTDGSDPVVNTDGTSPNAKRISFNSTATIEVSKATTIKAIAVRNAFTNSEITSFKTTAVKVAAPSFKVVGAIGGRNVTFSSTDKNAVIYYSTTTSNITTKDKCVKNGETKLFTSYYGSLYAKAYVNGTFSNVSRLILKIPTVNTPSITAEGNGYVKISTTTPSCAIYYTTDGTTPSPTNGKKINASSSKVYVGAGKNVKAIAVRSCFSNSAVATQKTFDKSFSRTN